MITDIDSIKTALPGYFMLSELAAVLGYADTCSLARRIRSGDIPSYKVGRTYLVALHVVKWLALKETPTKGGRGIKRK